MARIHVKSRRNHYWVTVSGRLEAADLRRLERACGRALEYPRVPLTLNFKAVTGIDGVARRYLERLVERGATLTDDRQ